MRWLALGLLVSTAYAQDKPYDVRTWIPKLSDPRESERALEHLEQLGDPFAIDAIAAAWEANGKPVRYLKVIVSLARPVTPQQAKDQFLVDYEQTGRPDSWAKAVPVLAKAATTFDIANPREIDDAQVAVDALGEANTKTAAIALTLVVGKKPDKRTLGVEVGALRSLGKLTVARKEVVAALRGVLATRVGPRDGIGLATVGAAINAAAQLRDPGLTTALTEAMFRNPPLFQQSRRALAATPGAADAVRPAMREKDKAFYAAVVIGDLHDAKSTSELLAMLHRPAQPAYVVDDVPSATTTHDAAFDALRKLGAKSTGKAIGAIWRDAKAAPEDRARAISVYPYVADDGADELIAIAQDNNAADDVRQEAARAAVLLTSKREAIAAYDALAKRYFDEAAKRQGNADKTAPEASAGEAAREKAKQKLNDARAKAVKVAQDGTASAEQIRAATAAAKQAEEEYKDAYRKMKEQAGPHREAENLVKGYTAFGRMFQAEIAAIDLALRCGNDAKCYAETLSRSLDKLVADAVDVDTKGWSLDERMALRELTLQRAMLELQKRGTGGDAVIALIGDDDRVVRQAALLSMPHVSPKPCPACVEQLSKAITATEGKTALADLSVEMQILRSYY